MVQKPTCWRVPELLLSPEVNGLLTKINQPASGALGVSPLARICQPKMMVLVMALDPEEFVILNDHGPMKLHSAVARAMMLPLRERDHASILRNGEPWILNFDLIKHLAMRWEASPFTLSDSEACAGAFSLPQVTL